MSLFRYSPIVRVQSKLLNETFFKSKEEEAGEFYGDHPVVTELKRLRGNLGEEKKSVSNAEEDNNIFTAKDVIHIRNEAAKRARIAGSIMHRRISDLFPSPWHLNDVILSGDRYARSSDYIIVAEGPIQTQLSTGKIDLILCKRMISDDGKRVYWKPVFVLEIKTRLGQSMYVDANYKESEVRSLEAPRIVSDFPLSDYPLSDDLWSTIIQSTPTPTARKQLNIYCQALSEQYKTTTEQELGHILRGVLVIEASADIFEIRTILQRLIIHGYEKMMHRVRSIKKTAFIPPECASGRIALIIDEQPRPKRADNEAVKVPWSPVYSPFKSKKKNKREFLLYLAGHSPTSAGKSAAWNARYYHGFQMLYEMKRSRKDAEFIWMDLASQFNEPQLAEARLRLRPRGYSEEEIAKVQPDCIREFFENTRVKGYLDEIISFLYNDEDIPSFDMKTGQERRVIVVSGVDILRDATPTSHQDRFSELIEHLLSSLPDDENTTVIWFDSPVPSVEKSIPYSTRALLPYYETSPLGEIVSEIIWNLPVAPRSAVQPEKWKLSTIGDAPMHDDIRVIIRHSPRSFHAELTYIPFLRGWSKRFRNKGTGKVIREQEVDDIVPERSVRDRMKVLSMTLLPWLVRLWPQETLHDDSTENLEELIAHLDKQYRGGTEPLKITPSVLSDTPTKPPSLLDLVMYRLPKTMDALTYQTMTAGKVNSQRLYRSPRKLQSQPLQRVPKPLSIQDVPDIEEELEQEWVFGVKFESEDEDIQSWWIVVQDPAHTARMLVGCFTDRPPDKDGFLWAESRQELLTESSLDDILGYSQTVMIGRRVEEKLEIWMSKDDDEPVYAGVFEFKGQGRSTISQLRAICQTFTEESKVKPSSDIRPSESFYKRMADSLRRHITTVTNPTPVSVHPEMMDDLCHVILRDAEGNEVQDIPVEYTADLVALLRWPTIKGGPMFTDSGEYVTWSIFDDIDYEELDFIAPYVTYTAARKTPVELPKRVSQFFDEVRSLSVSLSHDASICPIVSGTGLDHEACWRIQLPPDCPARVRGQLGRTLTGEEVNGLLAPGRLFAGRLYTLDFTSPTVSERNESIVFHEERYIRMFLRSKGLPLKKLPAGTFLHISNQQWIVSIGWEGNHFKWQARSTVTDLPFRGDNQIVELVQGHGAQCECERLLSFITAQISREQIHNYSELEEQVLARLKNRGYSKASPACDLRFIERNEHVCRYGVFLADDSQSRPLVSFVIEAGEGCIDTIIEEITTGFNEGDASAYNIRNVKQFMEHLSLWVHENIQEREWESEEPVEYEVTLTIDDSMDFILWGAKASGSEELKGGAIYYDLRALPDAGLREVIHEVREIFELEVVGELGEVSNLEDVMKRQIPEMVRLLLECKLKGY